MTDFLFLLFTWNISITPAIIDQTYKIKMSVLIIWVDLSIFQ